MVTKVQKSKIRAMPTFGRLAAVARLSLREERKKESVGQKKDIRKDINNQYTIHTHTKILNNHTLPSRCTHFVFEKEKDCHS